MTFRCNLWNDDPVAVAQEVNAYEKNIHDISGYTALVVHTWSTPMADVARFVENLDDDVEIVTAETFFRLIRENVKAEDKIDAGVLIKE